jgi:serine phosphatase RsbU (regulator of sigma subunit)
VLVTADGRAELLGQPGTLLGIFDAINTTTREVVLAPGDAVLFYTDGVTDLPDPDGLDPQALLRVFDDLPPGFTAEALIKHVRADLEARTAEHPRADDVALLVVRNAPG